MWDKDASPVRVLGGFEGSKFAASLEIDHSQTCGETYNVRMACISIRGFAQWILLITSKRFGRCLKLGMQSLNPPEGGTLTPKSAH